MQLEEKALSLHCRSCGATQTALIYKDIWEAGQNGEALCQELLTDSIRHYVNTCSDVLRKATEQGKSNISSKLFF